MLILCNLHSKLHSASPYAIASFSYNYTQIALKSLWLNIVTIRLLLNIIMYLIFFNFTI